MSSQFRIHSNVQAKVVLTKRKKEVWIDAKITNINDDGTYNLRVNEPQRWGVNPNAVQVPGADLREPPKIDIQVGAIVMVDNVKKGRVMWVGSHKVLPDGNWVGVALEQKRGFCDGMWKGVQFFKCKRWHGIVVLSSRVTKIISQPRPKAAAVVPKSDVITAAPLTPKIDTGASKPNPALMQARSVKAKEIEEKKEEEDVVSKNEKEDDDDVSKHRAKKSPQLSLDLDELRKAPKLEPPTMETAYFEEDPRTPVGDLKKTFDTFDLNNDGRISHEEMAAVMESLGAELELDEVLWLITEFDLNDNGTIEWVEFIRMMKGIGVTDMESLQEMVGK